MHTEPNDQLLIQEQQAEQVRRLQRAEQQRRQEHQQLLEDQEREEQRLLEQRQRAEEPRVDRGRKAAAQAADGVRTPEQQAQDEEQQEPRSATSGWFKRRLQKKDVDGDQDGEDAEADDDQDRPVAQESTSSTGGTGLGVGFVVVALLLAAGASFVGYRFLNGQADDQPAAVASEARTAPALPLAEPRDSRPAVVQAPGHAEPRQAEAVAAKPPVALPEPADAPGDLAPAATVAATPAGPAQPPVTVVTADAKPASSDTSVGAAAVTPDTQREQIQALEQRVAHLEQQLQGQQANPRPAPANVRPAGQYPRAAAAQTPTRPVAAAPRATPAPAPAAQGQLLAIDTWDGRPSVVVGTGMPGDQRVRVLQPGESFNGISLQSVDVQAGRATFSAAGGKPFTLQLHEAAQ